MDVQQDVELVTDLESTWELVTRSEDLAAWLGEGAQLDAVPGGTGRVVDDDGVERRIEVDEVSEHERIVWRWWRLDGDDCRERHPDGADADGGGTGTSVSRVEITLQPTELGTRLTVIEAPLNAPTVMTARAGLVRTQRSLTGNAWAGRLVSLELVGMLSASLLALSTARA